MVRDKFSKDNIDYVLLLVIVGLLVFSLIMITSIGVPKSIDLSKSKDILFPTCGVDGVDCYFLLKRHLARIGVGLIALLLGSKVPYRFWRKIAIPFFVAVFMLLVLIFIVGTRNNTAALSWINIYNNSFQPAEIAKLALIFYLASWLERKGPEIQDFKNGFVAFAVVAAIVVLPVVLQPDFGSTLIFTIIAGSLFFVAGGLKRHIALSLLVVFFLVLAVVPTKPYLKHRFISFFNPSIENCQPEPVTADGVRRNYCWQTEQSNIAIGSGGIFGKGLTQGIQKSYWLPQATDDFIFAASAEELGFIRIVFVVVAYMLIAYRGFMIAGAAGDAFGRLTATGITVWIVSQAFINIAVNTGLMPVTGVTLPFISYGGSSMASTLLAAGILLNISKQTTPHAYSIFRRRDRGTHTPQSRRYRRA
ncbi:MAG: putative peptidoglycan glycosyltransferase FtsW [Patescibacteria group bacterium]